MSVKTIVHPVTGRSFKLGRRRPLTRGPRIELRRYLSAALPAAPASIDYSAKPAAFLSQILGNDALGDCTAAGAFHIGGTLLANAGQPIPFTDADVIKFYSATTGYVPGDEATDQGGDEQQVLAYWRATGLLPGQHQISGWVAVDGTNQAEVEAALWLFENLYFGIELPEAWVNPMPSASGFTWGIAGGADPDNGHCLDRRRLWRHRRYDRHVGHARHLHLGGDRRICGDSRPGRALCRARSGRD